MLGTQMIQRADAALRTAGGADITTKMDKAMAQTGLLGRLDDLFQSHLNLIGILAAILGGQSQFVADTDAMGIGNNGGMPVNIG